MERSERSERSGLELVAVTGPQKPESTLGSGPLPFRGVIGLGNRWWFAAEAWNLESMLNPWWHGLLKMFFHWELDLSQEVHGLFTKDTPYPDKPVCPWRWWAATGIFWYSLIISCLFCEVCHLGQRWYTFRGPYLVTWQWDHCHHLRPEEGTCWYGGGRTGAVGWSPGEPFTSKDGIFSGSKILSLPKQCGHTEGFWR